MAARVALHLHGCGAHWKSDEIRLEGGPGHRRLGGPVREVKVTVHKQSIVSTSPYPPMVRVVQPAAYQLHRCRSRLDSHLDGKLDGKFGNQFGELEKQKLKNSLRLFSHERGQFQYSLRLGAQPAAQAVLHAVV